MAYENIYIYIYLHYISSWFAHFPPPRPIKLRAPPILFFTHGTCSHQQYDGTRGEDNPAPPPIVLFERTKLSKNPVVLFFFVIAIMVVGSCNIQLRYMGTKGSDFSSGLQPHIQPYHDHNRERNSTSKLLTAPCPRRL